MADACEEEPTDCGPVKVVYSREELLDAVKVFFNGNIRECELSSTDKLAIYGMLAMFVECLFSRKYDQQPRGGGEG